MTSQSFVLTSGYLTPSLFLDAILCVVSYLIFKAATPWIKSYNANRRLRVIPGPKSHWLYGHTKTLDYTSNGFRKRIELTSSFPSFYRIDLSPFLSNIVLHHPENIKAVLADNPPKGNALARLLRPYLGETSLIISHGAVWQRHRHLMNPIFSVQSTKLHLKVFNSTTSYVMTCLEDHVTSSEPINMVHVFEHMIFNNLCQSILSQKLQTSGRTSAFVTANMTAGSIVMKRLFNPFLWSDFVFNLTENGKIFRRSCAFIREEANRLIVQRRIRVKRGSMFGLEENDFDVIEEKAPDALDYLMKSRDEDGRGLSRQEIIDEVTTLFATGHETASKVLSWVAHLFAENPEHQEKCREEVLRVCGDKKEIEWTDLNQLTYMNLCVKETLRLYPPAPGIARKLAKPATIRDSYSGREYELEPGTVVTLLIYVLHHHPDIWENPEKFDPERFTPERSEGRHPHAYIPFGTMHRICIGKTFGLSEVKVALCHILRKYRFYKDHTTPKTKMSPNMFLGFVNKEMFVKVERV